MTFYEYIKEFTKVYRECGEKSPAVREARCVEVMSRYMFLPAEPGDRVAGRLRILPL